MNKKIVIAGGTGFIGKYLADKFTASGSQVIIISRNPEHISWKNITAIISSLENADLLINLAGKSVDCRYNEKNKAEILNSRTKTTTTLGEAILQCKNPPKLWINASTATIYRHAEDRAMTEKEGEIGKGFSVEVARNWEKSFFSFHPAATRQVALRMAIVLGRNGGVIKPLLNLVRFGLGGKQGNGNQMFSWIHLEDVFQILLFIEKNPEIAGIYNCSSPNPVDNKTLMRTLRRFLKINIGLPTPVWLLKFGAVLIKTEPELILKSRWVVPEKLLMSGYSFRYPTLDSALQEIFHHE
jgi:uncharacterized protein (TIGR01777 family)